MLIKLSYNKIQCQNISVVLKLKWNVISDR